MVDIIAIAPLAFFTVLGLGCAILIGLSLAELGRMFEAWLPAQAPYREETRLAAPASPARKAMPAAA